MPGLARLEKGGNYGKVVFRGRSDIDAIPYRHVSCDCKLERAFQQRARLKQNGRRLFHEPERTACFIRLHLFQRLWTFSGTFLSVMLMEPFWNRS